jgi:hypothetical protein
VEKQAAPGNDRRGRSIGGIGINERGDERWAKATRWVIRGSRLLSRVSVARVLGRYAARSADNGLKRLPSKSPFSALFAPFRGYFES